MKKSRLLVLLIGVVIFVSSCTAVKSTSTTVKTMDINGTGVTHFPVVVDLDVKETKVSGEANGMSTSSVAIKQNAIANALSSVNADVLVEPIYKTRTTNGRITITVTGYPATYKNFRKIKKEDFELINY